MTLSLGDRRRRFVRGLALAGAAVAGYAFGVTEPNAAAQPPAPLPAGMLPAAQPVQPKPGTPAPEADRRVVAYIYGNTPITREDLGDFLIARGGHEKLELLVNKKIIEVEAARRNITVTPVEIQAGLEENLRELGIQKNDFVKHVLPKYNKTLFEWTEDVIKPRIMLSKMCRDRVKVSDDEIQKAFENKHGERRQAKIITWNAQDQRTALKQWEEARKGDVEFDRIARMQADPNLAAAAGLVKPVGRHPEGQDAIVVETLFKQKMGEISGILEVPAGLMCVKCVAILPPDANAKLDDKLKAELHKELFARKLELAIPMCFKELKERAQPNVLLKGPTSDAAFREGVNQIVNQAGGAPMPPPMGTTPMGAPMPKP
jgi:hypothetical protein